MVFVNVTVYLRPGVDKQEENGYKGIVSRHPKAPETKVPETKALAQDPIQQPTCVNGKLVIGGHAGEGRT